MPKGYTSINDIQNYLGVILTTTSGVTAPLVTAGGTGYTSAPSVAINGGGGNGATATASINNGAVTGITITNSGAGFTSVPTVSITGGGGSGAMATVQLTPTQVARANTLLSAIEAYIDRMTRKSWLVTPITNEKYDLVQPQIFLKTTPVASIQSITVRSTAVGDTGSVLNAGTDYELQDPLRGEVRFADGYGDEEYEAPDDESDVNLGNQFALVSYTPSSAPIPADLSNAACLAVAHSLYMTLFPDRWGTSRFQVDPQTYVEYAEGDVTLNIPPVAHQIIMGYQMPLFV